MIYHSKDKRFRVSLPRGVLNQIQQFAATAGRMETGGIIIGKYEENHSVAVISEVSGPPIDSESGYSWFNRGIKGLRKMLNRRWENGLFYLGEWHYHPYSPPTPSWRDIQQMKDISLSKAYKCPEPILIIIGNSPGKFTIRLFVSLGINQLIELYP